MIKISVVTLFKNLYEQFLNTSLIDRATKNKIVSFNIDNLFNYSKPGERIDAPVYGHGTGMLIKPEIVEKAIENNEKLYGPAYKIFFSPHGELLTQDLLTEIYSSTKISNGSENTKKISNDTPKSSKKNLEKIPEDKSDVFTHIMLLPARYEGMDARVESHYANKIISVGNYVLMGGDLPAMLFIEAFLRLIPEVVGKKESVEKESFVGALVDFPQYTEPVIWKGIQVPDVIRSGNHKEMENWRETQAIERTLNDHFDWLRKHKINKKQAKIALDIIPSHYVVLMHSEVILPDKESGTTSVTSIDIHDIARSAKTYGFKGYFIVTPLLDQQKIIKKLLDFWLSDFGKEYNENRQEALKFVTIASTIEEVLNIIQEREGKTPLLVGTSARENEYEEHENKISFDDHKKVWKKKSPVLIIFGTGLGLSKKLLKKCNFMLPPVKGFSEFNHLSVRSAAAIVFDKWLGIN